MPLEKGGRTKPAWRIPDLGKKVDYLEGLLGYAFCKSRFDDQKIASALLINASDWARKKSGAPIKSEHLGRLVAYFGLPYPITHEVFDMDLQAFKQEIIEKVGPARPGQSGRIRQSWLADPKHRHTGISLELLKNNLRGGLGMEPAESSHKKVLSIGRQVRMQVEVPSTGHLLVLNDQLPSGDIICLSPSVLRPSTAVAPGKCRVPARESSESALFVGGPPGFYRLFAIWMVAPFKTSWLGDHLAHQPPISVSTQDLDQVDKILQGKRQRGEDYSIMTSDYQVVE